MTITTVMFILAIVVLSMMFVSMMLDDRSGFTLAWRVFNMTAVIALCILVIIHGVR